MNHLLHATKNAAVMEKGALLAPAKSMDQMQQIAFNEYANATLAGLFILVVVNMLVFGIKTILAARATLRPGVNESPFRAFQVMPGALPS